MCTHKNTHKQDVKHDTNNNAEKKIDHYQHNDHIATESRNRAPVTNSEGQHTTHPHAP